MNDFSDLEEQLKVMRPASPRVQFLSRLGEAMRDTMEEVPAQRKVIQVRRFQIHWAMGIGLAAAAAVFLLLRVDLRPVERARRLTGLSPTPAPELKNSVPVLRDQLIPTRATQVVYHTRNEGLVFPGRADQPVRRLRSHTRETLQWQNPATGASLRVSYPSEQVRLIPVSGQ
ncbi:MAG: hypothetical protein QOG67_887 [Verrucomicrobiota bacterium]|jgi:hypothetical protein